MPDPLVSVILPTYNRPEMLARALRSIEAQTVRDYEVLVVNDGGEDVRRVVRQFPQARYLAHKQNQGLPAARNTAIRAARGMYIAYLDDDDIWYPIHLQVCLAYIRDNGGENNRRRFVYSDSLYWYDELRLERVLSVDYDHDLLLKRNITPCICVMHERSLLDEVGLFDESLPNHEDYDLWLRISDIIPFYHIPIVTCAYSKRSTGLAQMSADPEVMMKGIRYVQERYWERKAQEDMQAQLTATALEIATIEHPKVLVFCPTYEHKGMDMLWPDTKESIANLIPPDDVEVTTIIGRDNPYPGGGHKNTLHQYQGAQRKALEEGYAALLTIEQDMIIPPDALVKLWNTPAPVVYGVYQLRHAIKGVNAFRKVEGKASPRESLTFYPELYREAMSRGWTEVGGVGNGCTLIRREALERFPFRGTSDNDPPDWQFSLDCEKAGVMQIARFDCICGHIDDDGSILWPGDEKLSTIVEPLQPFNCWIEGVSRPFAPGRKYEIPTQEALDLARAGWVTIERQDAPRRAKAQPRERLSNTTKTGVRNAYTI